MEALVALEIPGRGFKVDMIIDSDKKKMKRIFEKIDKNSTKNTFNQVNLDEKAISELESIPTVEEMIQVRKIIVPIRFTCPQEWTLFPNS